MNRTIRLRAAALSIAAAALLSVAPQARAQDAGSPIKLHYSFASGDRWAFDEDMTTAIKFNVLVGGKVAQAIDTTNHKVRKGDLSILEAAGERIDAVRARYGPECVDTEQAGAAEPQRKPSALSGQTVTVRRQPQGDASVECAVKLSDDEKKEARETLDPTEGFFPPKPIKVGDRWVATEKAIARALGLGADDRGTLRLALKSIRDVAGRRTAELGAALVIDQKQDYMKITLDLEGSILIDIDSGVAVGVDLRGPVTIAGETEQADASGAPTKITVDGGGVCSYKSSATRLGRETGSVPAGVPVPQASAPETAPAPLTVQIPDGWEGTKQRGCLAITPKDLPEGRSYLVLIPDILTRAGSLEGLLESGKASLSDGATFTPAAPLFGRNQAGWDHERVTGVRSKDGRPGMAQVVALRKGDEEGIILVMSDSAETMQRYADAIAAMVASVGAPRAASPPTVPSGR